MKKNKSVSSLFPLLVVLFLGYLGFSLALPLFPPMFLDETRSILPTSITPKLRYFALGALLAMYPLGQFFGCPILGKFSDKYGRKPVLLISLVIVIPAYIATGLSIYYTNIFFLYLSRLICGLAEGNIAIAQASIADGSAQREVKTKHFGFVVAVSSLGFVIGPLLGGKLADPTLVSWFNYATPFFFAGILVCIALIYVNFSFKETRARYLQMEISVAKIFMGFFLQLKSQALRALYGFNFMVYLAMFFLFGFFSVYLMKTFGFGVSGLAKFSSYLSIPIAIAPLFFGKISRRLSTIKVALVSSFMIGFCIIFMLLPSNPIALYLTLLPLGFFLASGFAYTAAMISERVDEHVQGHALGTNQSIQVLAEAITGVTGGMLARFYDSLPLIIGAVFAFIAGFYLITRIKKMQLR